MSETRSNRGRSESSAKFPPSQVGNARWIDRHPMALRAFQAILSTPHASSHYAALNPLDPSPTNPGSAYNSSPKDTSHGPLPSPQTQTQTTKESLRDEFWLAPLVVLVVIVWLRLALDAMGILPMNLGY